jgi:hypothetical protein
LPRASDLPNYAYWVPGIAACLLRFGGVGVSLTFCSDCLQTKILLISTSWVARIPGMSHLT